MFYLMQLLHLLALRTLLLGLLNISSTHTSQLNLDSVMHLVEPPMFSKINQKSNLVKKQG